MLAHGAFSCCWCWNLTLGSHWQSLVQLLNDLLSWLASLARGMAEPATADAVLNVEDQVIAWARSYTHRNRIQSKRVSGLPRHDMIGAGRITTHSQSAHEFALVRVERQPAAEDDHPADRFAHHGIILLTKVLRISAECDVRIRWTNDAVQRLARLGSGIDIPTR